MPSRRASLPAPAQPLPPAPRAPRHSASTMGLLYPEEAARELTVSLSTVYELIRTGKVKAVRMGKKLLRVRRADLERYIAGLGE